MLYPQLRILKRNKSRLSSVSLNCDMETLKEKKDTKAHGMNEVEIVKVLDNTKGLQEELENLS